MGAPVFDYSALVNKVFRAIIFALFLFPAAAGAIPPPDFIVSAGTQVAAVASVVFLFLSAAFGTAYQFVKGKLSKVAQQRWWRGVGLGLLLVTAASAVGAHFYFQESARQEELSWTEESQEIRTEVWEELPPVEEEELPEPSDFFETHKNTPLTLSNEALQEALSSGRNDFILLDAREDLEVEAGRIPGALHLRFADLMDGAWEGLDSSKYIYVICASAMRGEEVTQFLRERQLVAQYLEGGAESWVEWGGDFEGTIVFSEAFPNPNYHRYLSTSEVRSYVDSGALLIDAREPETFALEALPGSLSFALLYTPTEDLESKFNELAPGSTVITVCEDWINCFDAKLVGIELERRGHVFLGRYKTPYEY